MTEKIDPTLRQLQRIQAAFDAENDSGGTRYEDPLLHAGLHLVNAANKLLRLCEQSDHPETAPDTSIIDTEVIPDLLVLSGMLARVRGVDLATAYVSRLQSLEDRNQTTGSAARALRALDKG